MKAPTYYSAKQIAKNFDKDPHTIRDWINHGCPTPDGRVQLQAVKLGKSWQVKDEWLAVFELRVRPDAGRPDLELERARSISSNRRARVQSEVSGPRRFSATGSYSS